MRETEITLGDLARMIANGFADTVTKADFNLLGGRMGAVESRLDGVESRLGGVETRLGNLEVGQEEIKLRVDSFAYKFEVKELTRRVEVLEKAVGVLPT